MALGVSGCSRPAVLDALMTGRKANCKDGKAQALALGKGQEAGVYCGDPKETPLVLENKTSRTWQLPTSISFHSHQPLVAKKLWQYLV